MSKKRSPRIFVILECTECRFNLNKRSTGVYRYLVSKNKKNTPEKLELKKFCTHCNKHTVHKESK